MKIISNYYIVSEDEIKIRFYNESDPIEYIKKELTVIPKQFGNDEVLPMPTYKVEGDRYYLPYSFGIENFGLCEEDISLGYPIAISLKEEYSPREEQLPILQDCEKALSEKNRFLLESLPGSGKSYMATYLLCQLKRSTAIIVGKSALIDQWEETLLKFTNIEKEDIGIVKAEKFIVENKKVVLISTDSFYDRDFDESFLKQFGFIIMDEVHNFSAQKKYQAFGKFFAKYQLGMSATHDRRDNRDRVNQLWFGNIAVTGGSIDPVPINVILQPVYHSNPLPVNYTWFKNNNIDPRWTEITKLSQLSLRNDIFVEKVLQEYHRGREILCVSDRIEQLQELYESILDNGIPAKELGLATRSIYTGRYKVSISIKVEDIEPYRDIIKEFNEDVKYTLSKNRISARGFENKREVNDFIEHISNMLNVVNVKNIEKEKITLKDDEIKKILYDKNIKITFSSYGLLKEGVSIWWKDCLFDLTPQSRAEQLLGRIGRKAEDGETKRTPVAYSMWDYGNLSRRIKATHRNRLKNYKSMDYVTIRKLNVRAI